MNGSDNLSKTFLMNVQFGFPCEKIKMTQVANLFQLNLISLNEKVCKFSFVCSDMKLFLLCQLMC